jgi:hypothetical protein
VRRLLVTSSVVPSSPILVTLVKEAVPPKPRFLQEPHGVTSQVTGFFAVVISGVAGWLGHRAAPVDAVDKRISVQSVVGIVQPLAMQPPLQSPAGCTSDRPLISADRHSFQRFCSESRPTRSSPTRFSLSKYLTSRHGSHECTRWSMQREQFRPHPLPWFCCLEPR